MNNIHLGVYFNGSWSTFNPYFEALELSIHFKQLYVGVNSLFLFRALNLVVLAEHFIHTTTKSVIQHDTIFMPCINK